MRKILVCALGLAFAALIFGATKEVAIPFKQFKLKNGLTLLLSEDHTAPTYSIAVVYNVGSRDEKAGRTGFAHLFEHMMFQGSDNVAKGEYSALIAQNGGSLNGTTDNDRTLYFETLPANQLDLGLFLEADRMGKLAVTQANLDNQRNAVQEERRLRVDNQPYGKTFEAIDDLAYDTFAYKHSVIGSMADLNAASLQDVQEFFKRYYAPNNATIAIVGDFKTDDALAKVKKYFESIPAQPAPPKPDLSQPDQQAERRETLEDQFAQFPRIDIVYRIPAGDTADYYALSVMSRVLSSGQSSRLYQKLVKDTEVAANASAFANQRPGPSLLQISVTVRPGKDLAAVEKMVYDEIAKLQNQPAEDWEMDKVHMILRRNQVSGAQSTLNRAANLAATSVEFGDANLVNTEYQKLAAVTKVDIMRVAKKYLVETNRSVVITMPKAKTAGAAGN
ncbi:MAG TPA: pitrilysin family protein [Bryobacteraceae bacterium]|nr:pitrilysin family protein [Bryobacteraceae bacterium]